MTAALREHIRQERSRIIRELYPWRPDTWFAGTCNAVKAETGTGRDRERMLAAKRAWWHRTRGTGRPAAGAVSAVPAAHPGDGWGEHPWTRRVAA